MASAVFTQEADPTRRRPLRLRGHRHTFGVAPLLAVIGEPVSTFYDRTSRVSSVSGGPMRLLAERIEAIWERSCRSYGAPRIHAMRGMSDLLCMR